MGYRSFRDEQGRDWQAWDVVPVPTERRVQERRVHRASFEENRRRIDDRRVTKGVRPSMHPGMTGGWLCFEAEAEKRRLSPIPADWLACALDRLRSYLADAKPAMRLGTPTTQSLARH